MKPTSRLNEKKKKNLYQVTLLWNCQTPKTRYLKIRREKLIILFFKKDI